MKELGCVACHAVGANEAPKGPPLNLVSMVLPRREPAEAILLPNKTVAQGYPSAQLTRIPVSDIANRSGLAISMMPQGLTGDLTVAEFASLLDFIESLAR